MSRWYHWVAGFFVLNSMQAFGVVDRMIYGSWEGKGGDKITLILNLTMIAASLALFGHGYGRRQAGFAVGSALALSAIGFLFLTALWSGSPPTTVRLAIVYVFVVVGAIGVARSLTADEFMHLLNWCCFWSAIASLLLLVVSPASAHMSGGASGDSDFIGIFPHKNVLGQVMATGALAALHDIRVARGRYPGKLVMLFVFVGMAFASKSTGALLTTLVFCGISGYFALRKKGGTSRVIAGVLAVILVPVFAVAMAAPDMILELIGKDPTLTGRTEIWAYVIDDIWRKPLLGWGYYGFWMLDNPAAVEISDAVQWVVPQAHNGLLEFLLNIGLVGTGIFVVILVRIFLLACRCLGTPARALAISTITVCLGIILEGISETVLLAPTESLTPVLFIAGLMCERAVWVAKGQPYRTPLPADSPSYAN
jgi:O-antigen ligase